MQLHLAKKDYVQGTPYFVLGTGVILLPCIKGYPLPLAIILRRFPLMDLRCMMPMPRIAAGGAFS